MVSSFKFLMFLVVSEYFIFFPAERIALLCLKYRRLKHTCCDRWSFASIKNWPFPPAIRYHRAKLYFKQIHSQSMVSIAKDQNVKKCFWHKKECISKTISLVKLLEINSNRKGRCVKWNIFISICNLETKLKTLKLGRKCYW